LKTLACLATIEAFDAKVKSLNSALLVTIPNIGIAVWTAPLMINLKLRTSIISLRESHL
jgi:hypothetical protein